METTVQWRHVITDCVCLVTEMAPVFLSVCSSGYWTGAMLSSCFSSSTWAWLPSLFSLFPTISLSLFPLSPSLSISLFLSLWHWALLPSLTIWASPPRKCVCVCACAFEWEQFLLKRTYMCMSVFWFGCMCLFVRVSVSSKVFLRQVDSCYLVALQPSQQSQGEWAGGLNPLYSKAMLNVDNTVGCVCVCVYMCSHY